MTQLIELDLVSPTARLIEDLGGMSAVAILGFTGASAEQTNAALRQVATDRRWAFADLRDPKSKVNLDAPVLVVATSKTAVAHPLATRIGELVEKRPGLRQKLIVLCEAVTRHAELPRELARVSYSEFLPG
ncbi:MAG: hypothetical protein ACAI38_22450 [Myxococcota bacterium]|nr:hypothetical protein [Myxococcota bacterium]